MRAETRSSTSLRATEGPAPCVSYSTFNVNQSEDYGAETNLGGSPLCICFHAVCARFLEFRELGPLRLDLCSSLLRHGGVVYALQCNRRIVDAAIEPESSKVHSRVVDGRKTRV